MGAVDTAAVHCQALGYRKQLQRNSFRIPGRQWLLVPIKEWTDDEMVLPTDHGTLSLSPVDSEGRGSAHRLKPSRRIWEEERNGRHPLPFVSLLLCVKHFTDISSFHTQRSPLWRFFTWHVEASRYFCCSCEVPIFEPRYV